MRRWRSRSHELRERWQVRRESWAAERELERQVAGTSRLLVGPWTGEVGYEVLYWVPFLRWLCAAYRLAPERLVSMSRGGVGAWYGGIANTYVDVFEAMPADEYARRARAHAGERGTSKQYDLTPLDRDLVGFASRRAGAALQVVHPSLMYRLFRAFWSGLESMSFLERHVRFARMTPPRIIDPAALPRDYIAVKFYSARSLPSDPAIRATLRSLVASLAMRTPVVLLDTDVRVDEHEDFSFDDVPNALSARTLMTPANNLGVQTEIIAGARAFVGTCGSVAWLAPMLGVDTTALLADAGFLHAHLHVARRAFHRLGAGAFSPCDVGALSRLGLTVTS